MDHDLECVDSPPTAETGLGPVSTVGTSELSAVMPNESDAAQALTKRDALTKQGVGNGRLLPPELMVMIFWCVRDAWPLCRTASGNRADIRRALGWINVSHVCSLWREVRFATRCEIHIDR